MKINDNHSIWLGKNKWQIKQALHETMETYIEFVHWLAIPSQQVLLQFDKQNCVKVTDKILL